MSDFTIGRFGITQRPSFRTVIGGAVSVFREMLQARATRRLLGELDDRQLADIGIGHGDALDESLRPMWTWRRASADPVLTGDHRGGPASFKGMSRPSP